MEGAVQRVSFFNDSRAKLFTLLLRLEKANSLRSGEFKQAFAPQPKFGPKYMSLDTTALADLFTGYLGNLGKETFDAVSFHLNDSCPDDLHGTLFTKKGIFKLSSLALVNKAPDFLWDVCFPGIAALVAKQAGRARDGGRGQSLTFLNYGMLLFKV